MDRAINGGMPGVTIVILITDLYCFDKSITFFVLCHFKLMRLINLNCAVAP